MRIRSTTMKNWDRLRPETAGALGIDPLAGGLANCRSHSRRSRSGWLPLAVGILCLATFGLAVPAPAQDFRVETEVFTEDSKEPVVSLTLFTGDFVYDFLTAPSEETTIFDVRRGKLSVLDSDRRVKTSLTTEQLENLSKEIKELGMRKGASELFAPKFETVYVAEQLALTLTSSRLTYKAKGSVAKHPDSAHRYRQFADWHARLNALRPGNVPPFGRLDLNQGLAERNLIPEEVERIVSFDRPIGNRTMRAKSKHAVNWIISGTDQKHIEQAGQQLVAFKEVSPDEFWSTPVTTARAK